jgi:very-short-patch-repair endonuclease
MFEGAGRLLFERAAELRKNQTFTEEILWNYLRAKPLGFKFRRQHPYSCYILDFYCHALKLAIEVDGSIHKIEEMKASDQIRQLQLEELGLNILRFTNDQLTTTPEEIIKQLESYLRSKVRPK